MVDKIYEIKNNLIKYIDKMAGERGGVERINVSELGLYVDMVKDLAEAEEKCWKAAYYRSVTESMEQKSGYQGQGGGTGSSAGYGGRMGYDGMYQARSGYGGTSGHHEVAALVERLEMASPEEKEHIKNELRMKVGI